MKSHISRFFIGVEVGERLAKATMGLYVTSQYVENNCGWLQEKTLKEKKKITSTYFSSLNTFI